MSEPYVTHINLDFLTENARKHAVKGSAAASGFFPYLISTEQITAHEDIGGIILGFAVAGLGYQSALPDPEQGLRSGEAKSEDMKRHLSELIISLQTIEANLISGELSDVFPSLKASRGGKGRCVNVRSFSARPWSAPSLMAARPRHGG